MNLHVLDSRKDIQDLEKSAPLKFISESSAYFIPERFDSLAGEKKMFQGFHNIFTKNIKKLVVCIQDST